MKEIEEILAVYEEALRMMKYFVTNESKYNYLVRHNLQYGICVFLDRSGYHHSVKQYLELPVWYTLWMTPYEAARVELPVEPLIEIRVNYLKKYIK